jgi:hypothetical protein
MHIIPSEVADIEAALPAERAIATAVRFDGRIGK